MNTVGMFLEESEEKDFLGIFSFIFLTYIIAPFQAYASVKGFLERTEGPWFRTPKTGKITDTLHRGGIFRWLGGFFPIFYPGEKNTVKTQNLSTSLYLKRGFAFIPNHSRSVPRKKSRWIARTALVVLLMFSTNLYFNSQKISIKGQQIAIGNGLPIIKNQKSDLPRKDFRLSELPAFNYKIDKLFKTVNQNQNTIWGLFRKSTALALENTVETHLYDYLNQEVPMTFQTQFQGEQLLVKLAESESLKPGGYRLQMSINHNGQQTKINQNFTWGVLAVNTNKSIYAPDETAKISVAVLDEWGEMVCDAKLIMVVTDPNGMPITLTTDNGSIQVGQDCNKKILTQIPDYLTTYKVNTSGTYTLLLEAETATGKYSITDEFRVENNIPFSVERTSATRIYPPQIYEMKINIIPKQVFQGKIEETAPKSFLIVPDSIGEHGVVTQNEDKQQIIWDVDWQSGKRYTLSYKYDVPNTSPAFYTLGGLKFIDKNGQEFFNEIRSWQIAVDADTGLLSPTSTGEDFTAWSFGSRAYSSNDAYATSDTSLQRQDYYNFTFNIPANATIDGIEVQEEVSKTGGNGGGKLH